MFAGSTSSLAGPESRAGATTRAPLCSTLAT